MTTPYGATVHEHFRRPRNQRTLERPSVAREGYNPLCGDRVRIELDLGDGAIRAAVFTANACAVCTASASLLTERVTGVTIAAALRITEQETLAALNVELPPGRLRCATLPLHTLRDALAEPGPAA